MLNVRHRGGHRSAPGNYSFGTEETTVRHRETFFIDSRGSVPVLL